MAKKHKQGVLLDHNYDGIQELDNDLPPWWVYLFYLTIVISIVYVFVYHVSDFGPDQAQEYRNEVDSWDQKVAAIEAAKPVEESLAGLVPFTDDVSLNKGQQIFASNCAACHAMDGGGGIGPNMTDKYWIHGEQFSDIIRTIKVGVPEKGMIPWKGVLNSQQIKEVGSYILTLQGTTPAKPKEPQGQLYE